MNGNEDFSKMLLKIAKMRKKLNENEFGVVGAVVTDLIRRMQECEMKSLAC